MGDWRGLGAEPPASEGKGSLGAKPSALGDFLQFFNKNNTFLTLNYSHF